MPLDSRSTFILRQLVNADDFVYANDLMKKLKVSRRTIYYDLEKINSWLKDQKLQPVQRSYSKGFFLIKETKDQVLSDMGNIHENQYFFTKDDRISLLGVLLILEKEPLKLKDLMKKTDVSRVTAFNDLDSLKKDLMGFDLLIVFDRINGYLVKGEEGRKRKALAYYLTQLFTYRGWEQFSRQIQSVLNQELSSSESKSLADYYSFILGYENYLEIGLTDEMLNTLALNLFIICKRLEQGEAISWDQYEKSAITLTAEYTAAQRLAKKMEKWNGSVFPEDEVCFLAVQLLSAKVVSTKPKDSQTKEMNALKKALKKMIFDFQRYACLFFQDQEELENLMFIHLKPAFYRIKYDVFTSNPLAENIKNQYHEVYQITKKVIHHLESLLDKEWNESETAYLAMYFGGWVRRQGTQVIVRKRAVIVCGTGFGTSNLLRIQLEQLLSTVDIVDSISLREYQQNDYDVDLFFSTISIHGKDKPVILVNPILSDEDKRSLLARIQTIDNESLIIDPTLSALLDVIQKHTKILDEKKLIQDLKALLQPNKLLPKEIRKPMLHELLTEEMIQFKSSVDNWEEAIRVAASPLLTHDYVTNNYIDAMVENVKDLGPYIVIVPNIAIPHARPEEGVKRLGMSLLRLEEPVVFSTDKDLKAQLVIVLAAVDNEAHLKALSQLTMFLGDEEKVSNVLSASSEKEVTELLKDVPVK